MHIHKVQRKIHVCNSLYNHHIQFGFIKENLPYCSGEQL